MDYFEAVKAAKAEPEVEEPQQQDQVEHHLEALQQRPLQHHPHQGHGARVHEADAETVHHQPGQDVIRTLYSGP